MEKNNNTSCSSSSSRSDRKVIERNRRNQMKSLFSTLNSLLIPHLKHSSKEAVSLPDQLDNAVKYIKKLQMKVERMKEKRERLLLGSDHHDHNRPNMRKCGLRSPVIEVHDIGSAILQIVLITGLDSQIMFNEAVRVLHQEGVEIINATFSVIDDTIFHSIHSKVGDSAPGYAAARISERLNKFVEDSNAF